MAVRILAVIGLLASLAAFAQDASAPQSSAQPASPEAASADDTSGRSSAGRAALDLTPDASGKLSQSQMRELTRVVAENYRENFRRERDYTYVERDVENSMDGKGKSKSTEIRSYEVLEIYGEQVRKLIEKEDRPLDAREAAKEDQKIQKIIDERKSESDEDRRKREKKQEKQREDSRKFVTEVADTYDFTLVGTELVGGREAWVIDGEPRKGFEPHEKDAKFLSKFRGRLWIDKDDLQLAKMDVEAIDTASVGWVLARIHKGTRFMFERTRMNDEIWLPRHLTFKLDARVALLKGLDVEGEQTYRDYKKFRTTSRIVGMGEVK